MIAVLHDLDLVRAQFPRPWCWRDVASPGARPRRRCRRWRHDVGARLLVAPFETLGFMRAALVACLALALANGAVGTLLVLRRMSLDGDVLGPRGDARRGSRLPLCGPVADLAIARRPGERTGRGGARRR